MLFPVPQRVLDVERGRGAGVSVVSVYAGDVHLQRAHQRFLQHRPLYFLSVGCSGRDLFLDVHPDLAPIHEILFRQLDRRDPGWGRRRLCAVELPGIRDSTFARAAGTARGARAFPRATERHPAGERVHLVHRLGQVELGVLRAHSHHSGLRV